MTTVLDRRALNRATLARQLLLRRSDLPVTEAVEHLVGLQAQTTHTWYVGLWCRLERIRPEEVGALLADRSLVRMALMRSTIHLVTARDACALREVLQPAAERPLKTNWLKFLPDVDLDAVVERGRELVGHAPLTFSELGALLGERFPGQRTDALAQVIRCRVPLIQVPPRGVWGRSGLARHMSIEAYLEGHTAPAVKVDELVLRYLAAFGPATVRDAQTWSDLTRLGEVFEGLRRRLVTFRDESGAELFDLPEAPRPDRETPAPVRLLYDYDNLLLSHADRSRVIPPAVAAQRFDPTVAVPRMLLIDGFTSGTWLLNEAKGSASVTIIPFRALTTEEAAALDREARGLLAFASAKADKHEVRFMPPRPGSESAG